MVCPGPSGSCDALIVALGTGIRTITLVPELGRRKGGRKGGERGEGEKGGRERREGGKGEGEGGREDG